MPPHMTGSPTKVGGSPAPAPALTPLQQRELDAKNKLQEIQMERSKAEAKKRAYQEWLNKNELDEGGKEGDDGILVTDTGVTRTKAWVRTLDSGPDPPLGTASMVNNWLPDKLVPDFATFAARQSVRQGVEDGILTKQIGFDKSGTFHPVRHFHSGSAYERYRRGMPPGYMGHIPHDATPVTGGKIGVIEKKHPILYSTVRPATGAVVADIMDDVFDNEAGVGTSMDDGIPAMLPTHLGSGQ